MPDAHDTFRQFAAEARRIIPFGIPDALTRAGLLRRAVALGVTEEAARAILDEMYRRPRHPVTRGIE